MTIDQLVSTLQAYRANGHGQLEVAVLTPYDSIKSLVDKHETINLDNHTSIYEVDNKPTHILFNTEHLD